MITKKPKVSIITVCYNSFNTIEQTILSVVGQTYSNIEYIIIDGCSTDGTLNIIKKYNDNITYWISESDKGIYDAMNKGLAKVTGDIIGIINSDDWYGEKTVENVVKKFLVSECDVVHGDIIRVYEDIDMHIRCQPATDEQLWHKTAFYHPTLFVKKSIYDKFGFFRSEFVIAGDYELILRFYTNGVKFSYLPEDLVYFRIGGASTKQIYTGYREIRDISIDYGYSKIKANLWYLRHIILRRIYIFIYKRNFKSILQAYFKYTNKNRL